MLIDQFCLPQIQLGWHSYLLPTLSHLTSLTLSKTTHPSLRALPTIPRHTSVTNTSVHTTLSHTQHRSNQGFLVEKLPSFIPVSSQISESTFNSIPQTTLRQYVFTPELVREMCLQNTVEKLLEAIPQPWKKVLHSVIVFIVHAKLIIKP